MTNTEQIELKPGDIVRAKETKWAGERNEIIKNKLYRVSTYSGNMYFDGPAIQVVPISDPDKTQTGYIMTHRFEIL